MIINNEYNKEFDNLLHNRIVQFVGSMKRHMIFGTADLSIAVSKYLEENLQDLQTFSCTSRLAGYSQEKSFSHVDEVLRLLCFSYSNNTSKEISEKNIEWDKSLNPYIGYRLIYSDNMNNIIKDSNYISILGGPSFIVTLDEITEIYMDSLDDVVALQLSYTPNNRYDSPYLRRCFPYIHNIANSLSWLLTIVQPECVVLYNSDSIASTVVQAIASESDSKIVFRSI